MIKIAVCDDSKDDAAIIEKAIAEYMEEKRSSYKIDLFTSGEALVDSEEDFHIIFLDISMGEGMSGIAAGEKIQNFYKKTKIIYTTSFQQFFEQALNQVHAFAYLVKPVEKKKLVAQLDAVMNFLNEEEKNRQMVSFEVIHITKESKVETVIKQFDIEEIFYFKYVNRKIMIRTKSGDFFFGGQMKKLMERMRQFAFESCHQSYCVNMRYVKKIKGYELYLNNGETIPVSQKKSSEFREKLNKYIQNNI